MAALRSYVPGSVLAALLRPVQPSRCAATSGCVAPAIAQIQQRWSSYKSSAIYTKPEDYTDYEISNDPNEWKYVERLLKYKIIPKPPSGDSELPSGFKPARASPRDNPYFIERTKNHMQPVYLFVQRQPMKRLTKIKRIQGDIWKLEQDLKEHIKNTAKIRIGCQIYETSGMIIIRGDYVNHVKEWMDTKGF